MLECILQEAQVTAAIGIRCRIARRLVEMDVSPFDRALFVRKRLEPAVRADAIDVSLRQHRTQPRRQAAAALKVAKERLTVEIRVQGIGEIARTARWVQRVGGAVEDRPVLEDEALPGLLVPGRALPCELEIGGVRGTHARSVPQRHHYRVMKVGAEATARVKSPGPMLCTALHVDRVSL
jgi:hypothetical protein